MFDTIETPITDKLTEPAKRWRNKWRETADDRWDDGEQAQTGQIAWSEVYPSRDVAETAAQEIIEYNKTCDWQPEYLGAFPVTP